MIMEVKIQTLTPLWSGGVGGNCDRIHETGIIGSMRWWYETIVRGVGGMACDPSQSECRFDDKEYRKSTATDKRQQLRDAGLCDVCQVFGATGWRRRFRMEVVEDNITDASIQSSIKANRTYIDRYGVRRIPTWYFKPPNTRYFVPPKTGIFTIQVHSLAQDFPLDVIGGLLQSMADWTALGSKAQMGFGVIQPSNGRLDTQPFYNWIKEIAAKRDYNNLPSLQNVFLARIYLKNADDQDTFNLKYDLRRLFAKDQSLRHFIMGTVKGQRIAAKVKISRPNSDGLIRVWGWIPVESHAYRNGWDRGRILQMIYNHLKNPNVPYSLQVWREIGSMRDTVDRGQNNPLVFLQNLLQFADESDTNE
jgi:CRISPR-associated protein Cmr1